MEGQDMDGGGGGEENVGLLVLEPKSLRPFKTKDEYLYAMKEDLAEWFKCLYEAIVINAENFLEVLETGVLLCQHANKVRKFTDEQKAKGELQLKSNFAREIQIPQYDVQFRVDVKPGTFLARDNISNFITWTAKMGIQEVLRFETDDLVMRKNERSVVLCLLEVARVGARFGMLAPTIVQMEEEIDNEIETGEPPPQIITCDVKSLDEMVRELVGRCTCPKQFPIIKVGEGKYKIGDNQTLVFVRILRKHVMIRVGGGWDTLEHYLDRHDPCRCGFQGHRVGSRAPSTPRRASVATASQSLPNTPKTARKLSLAATHGANTARPASPSMRSASPGPNSGKLSLVVKNSHSQPGSSVTSPAISNKQPSFSVSGLNQSGKQGGLNSSGNFPVGNFVKQTHANLTRQSSSGLVSNQQTSALRRSASPTQRPQSPASRRSESPAPTVASRLRSPSPAPSNQPNFKGARTQSVPASPTGRCASPMKQITLSELRSSREGTINAQQQQQKQQQSKQEPLHKQTVRRQLSSSSSISEEMMAEATSSGLSIDQISTMSLAEFKNILNSKLAVPNGSAESQCSSDSPRSQGSVESPRGKKDKYAHVKSSYCYRSPSANKPSKVSGSSSKSRSNVKADFDHSVSSGYSSSSVSSDKTVSSPYSATRSSASSRPKTPTNAHSNGMYGSRPQSAKGSANSNLGTKSSSSYSMYDQSRSKSPVSVSKSKSNMSSISDTDYLSYQSKYRSADASRSSSHSSLRSYESMDSQTVQTYETCDETNMVPLTPSSVDSDYSLVSTKSCPPGVSSYSRSNSYTPCSAADDKSRWDRLKTDSRANSEPREIKSNDYNNKGGDNDNGPLNVGYASFSYSDDIATKKEILANELDEIQNEIMRSNNCSEDTSTETRKESSTGRQSIARPTTPSGRKTPSFIPRPMTPKMSKTLSVPQDGETNETPGKQNESRRTGRPPTPKKSNIIARAPGVRGADSSKEQSYKEIFQKRSMTPGPGNRTTSMSNLAPRRSSTPGPYLHKSTSLNNTSATTTKARLNESLKQSKDMPLSVFNGQSDEKPVKQSVRARSQSVERKRLTSQSSTDKQETVIMVNRANGQHIITVEGEEENRKTPQKSKVLARARTDDSRARSTIRTTSGGTRPRPQSVEPKQLMSRKGPSNSTEKEATTVRHGENGERVYDRTQEWVQYAVEQTKVKKSPKNTTPKVRRAMTPNSFNMRIDVEKEEPRSLDEIKAALTLPINGIAILDPDALEAPPEDPEMYATMEKLFHELRQQELKNSVNETPGSSMNSTTKSNRSRSTSSNNDEEISLDSNKNVKRKTLSVSTKSSSNVTSPALSRANKSGSENRSSRPKPASRTSSSSSVSTSASANRPTTQRTNPAHVRPSSPKTTVPVSNNSYTQHQMPPRPMSPKTTAPAPRPASPRTTAPPRTPVERPASPRTTAQRPAVQTSRPASPRTTVTSQRPPSPKSTVTSPNNSLSKTMPSPARPSSPSQFKSASLRVSTHRSPSPGPGAQPARPASTPPRPSTPVDRHNSQASDESDNVFETNKKIDDVSLISKIKEIIKVKPRKAKVDSIKQKTRIPAPRSLASVGKSRSLSNISTLSNTMSLAHTDTSNMLLDEPELNGYSDSINGGLNVTLSGRSETPAPKLITPLATGRSTLIRKESMDKNQKVSRFVKAVSVDRDLSSYQQGTYDFYEDGEYV